MPLRFPRIDHPAGGCQDKQEKNGAHRTSVHPDRRRQRKVSDPSVPCFVCQLSSARCPGGYCSHGSEQSHRFCLNGSGSENGRTVLRPVLLRIFSAWRYGSLFYIDRKYSSQLLIFEIAADVCRYSAEAWHAMRNKYWTMETCNAEPAAGDRA